jgi:uncharacterized protein (TIGR02145 family)
MLLGLFLNLGCKKEDATPTQQATTVGSIQGKVLYGLTGAGIPNVSVQTIPPSSAVLTSTTGDFTIDEAETGTYTVIASKNTYTEGRITVTVTAGETTTANLLMNDSIGQIPSTPALSNPLNNSVFVPLPITCVWNASTGATSYTLQISASSEFGNYEFNQSGLIGTSRLVTGLKNFRQYYWRVSATNSFGTTGYSEVFNFNTEPGGTAPNAPILVTPANNANQIVLPPTLTWSASTGATSYSLQVSASSTFQNFAFDQSGLTEESKQVTALRSSTKYYWRVKAFNSFGASDYSTTYNFTTDGTVPSTPTLVSPLNNSSVPLPPTLIWNASTGAASYTLQISTDSTFTGSVNTISNFIGSTIKYTMLLNRTKYYWRVTAQNSIGNSEYSSIYCFTTTIGGGLPCAGTPTVTYRGKIYNTVQIHTQCWLKENLDVGEMIQGSVTPSHNGIVEKYCYDNNAVNCATYGGLYNWNEAMEYLRVSGGQGICPSGWHIPSVYEFQDLFDAVSGNNTALKAIGQGTGGGQGTNESGFSALLAGSRDSDGQFYHLLNRARFWSSTEYGAINALNMYFFNYDSSIYFSQYFGIGAGLSIRCVKN